VCEQERKKETSLGYVIPLIPALLVGRNVTMQASSINNNTTSNTASNTNSNTSNNTSNNTSKRNSRTQSQKKFVAFNIK
jgi:hypothetical protein